MENEYENKILEILVSHIGDIIFLTIGGIIGFFTSFWATKIYQKKLIKKIEAKIKPLEGNYKVFNKKDLCNSDIVDFNIKLKEGNVIETTFTTKDNGKVKGVIEIMNMTLGKGCYYHIEKEKENLSGFHEILIKNENELHLRAIYINKNTHQEVNEFYICKK